MVMLAASAQARVQSRGRCLAVVIQVRQPDAEVTAVALEDVIMSSAMTSETAAGARVSDECSTVAKVRSGNSTFHPFAPKCVKRLRRRDFVNEVQAVKTACCLSQLSDGVGPTLLKQRFSHISVALLWLDRTTCPSSTRGVDATLSPTPLPDSRARHRPVSRDQHRHGRSIPTRIPMRGPMTRAD